MTSFPSGRNVSNLYSIHKQKANETSVISLALSFIELSGSNSLWGHHQPHIPDIKFSFIEAVGRIFQLKHKGPGNGLHAIDLNLSILIRKEVLE